MLYKLAIRYLIWKLKSDDEIWYGWQSNIAMTISDNMSRYFPLATDPIGSPTQHEFCNICANDFLKLLTFKTIKIEGLDA